MARAQLSPNFFLDEFTFSQEAARRGLALEIARGSMLHRNVARLVHDVLQPVRDALGPVHVTSGYRTAELNRLIGGSANSQHMQALAADILVAGVAPLDVALWIADHLPLAFDQLIHEFGQWTHVSVAAVDAAPRGDLLTAYRSGGKTLYAAGLRPIKSLQEAA